jgi:hypothetical protein
MCQCGQGFNGKDQAKVELTVMVAVMISRAIAKRIRLLRYAFSMVFRPVSHRATTTARFGSITGCKRATGGQTPQ